MMNELVAMLTPLISLFVIGLLGAGHCVGMCGGITAGLGAVARQRNAKSGILAGEHDQPYTANARLIVGYNLGRICSYSAAGALFAVLALSGSRLLAIGPWLHILSGIILIFMGLSMAQYLAPWANVLQVLERLGGKLWRYIQPLAMGLMPVTTLPKALAFGALWGWLPCGLVYSALAYTATGATHPAQGALMMLAFGLGTTPAMIAGGMFANRWRYWLQRRGWRQFMGALMVALGLWTLHAGFLQLGVWPEAGAHQHHH